MIFAYHVKHTSIWLQDKPCIGYNPGNLYNPSRYYLRLDPDFTEHYMCRDVSRNLVSENLFDISDWENLKRP